MSTTTWATGGILFVFFMIFIFAGLSVYNIQASQDIQCKQSAEELAKIMQGNNSAVDIVFKIGASISSIANPCSGLPWYFYVILIVLVIGIGVWLTPFIGS